MAVWGRWGRGACEGYSLSLGDGYIRFAGSVSCSVPQHNGGFHWLSSINGICSLSHATREEAMARVEHELRIAGEAFVASFTEYKTHRHKNKFSQAVDAMLHARKSAHLTPNGPA